MKQIIFITLAFITIFCHAQDATSVLTINGNIRDVKRGSYLDGDTIVVHLDGVNVEDNFKWSLSLLTDEDEYVSVIETQLKADSFAFEVTPALFAPVRNHKNIEFSNDSSVYNKGMISLYRDGILVDSLTILFNVLPSRPRVKRGNLNGVFDFQDKSYRFQAALNVMFSSARMDRLVLAFFSAQGKVDEFNFPKDYSLVLMNINSVEHHGSLHEMLYNQADWGEYYSLIARNEYGGVWGDTISTNDYISDSDVLEVLEAIRTVIEDIGEDDVRMNIFDLNGYLLYSVKTKKLDNLSFLSQGIYIVCMSDCKNRVITKKIIRL